jgi:hypothetical protein
MNPKANAHTASRARLGKKKKSKPASVQNAAAIVWDALETAHALLENENTAEKLRACHAIFQGATAYGKLFEIGELEARLELLEQQSVNEKKGVRDEN